MSRQANTPVVTGASNEDEEKGPLLRSRSDKSLLGVDDAVRAPADSVAAALLEGSGFARANSVKLNPREISEGVVDVKGTGVDQYTVRLRRATSTQTFFNVLKSIIGAAVLTIPDAYAQAGLVYGVFSTTLCVCATILSGQTLIEVRRVMIAQGRVSLSAGYEQVVYVAFGKGKGGLIVAAIYDVSAIIFCIGTCVAFLDYMIAMMSAVVGAYGFDPNAGINKWIAPAVICAMEIPFVLLRSLRFLSYTSFIGIVGLFVAISVVYADMFTHHSIGQERTSYRYVVPGIGMVHAFGKNLFMFSYHTLHYTIETSMEKPERFGKVNAVGNIVAYIFAVSFGALGYLFYGNTVNEVVFDNVKSLDWALVCKAFIFFEIFFSFPLFVVNVREIVEDILVATVEAKRANPPEWMITWLRNWVRITIVACILVTAVLVPEFTHIVDIVTGVPTCFFVFFLPHLMHIIVVKPHWCRVIVDVLVLVFFGTSGIILTYTGLRGDKSFAFIDYDKL